MPQTDFSICEISLPLSIQIMAYPLTWLTLITIATGMYLMNEYELFKVPARFFLIGQGKCIPLSAAMPAGSSRHSRSLSVARQMSAHASMAAACRAYRAKTGERSTFSPVSSVPGDFSTRYSKSFFSFFSAVVTDFAMAWKEQPSISAICS